MPVALVHPAIVVGLGGVTILIVAGHLMALQQAEMPARRKRIRTVNGLLMLVTTPLLAFAFGYATPESPRLFLTLWMTIIALLALIIVVGLIDVAYTAKLTTIEARRARRELAVRLRERAMRERALRLAADNEGDGPDA